MSTTRNLSRWFCSLVMAVAVVAVLGGASAAQALNQARLYGTITDENDKPVAGVLLTVTCPEVASFKLEIKTDAKGNWAVTLIDATKSYHYKYEKDGYQTMQQDLKIPIGVERAQGFPDAHRTPRRSSAARPWRCRRSRRRRKRRSSPSTQGAEASQMGDMATAKQKMLEAVDAQSASDGRALGARRHALHRQGLRRRRGGRRQGARARSEGRALAARRRRGQHRARQQGEGEGGVGGARRRSTRRRQRSTCSTRACASTTPAPCRRR